jgi:hypothetical protein
MPLANGVHSVIKQRIYDWIKTNNTDVDLGNNRYYRFNGFNISYKEGDIFLHSNVFYYFHKHYGIENLVSVDDVVEDDDCVYFFPIELHHWSNDAIQQDFEFTLDGTTYTYHFPDTLTPGIVDLMRKGKVKPLVSCLTEPTVCEYTTRKIETAFTKMGIDGKNVNFLQGNIRNDYHARGFGVAKLGTAHASMEQQVDIAHRYPIPRSSLPYESDYVKVSDLDSNVIRPKRFLSWNRSMNRDHRLALMYEAIENNWLDDSLFSFLTNVHYSPYSEMSKLIDGPKDEVKPKVDKLLSMLPYEIDTQTLTPEGKQGFQTNENNKKEYYANTYVHITSETQFDDGVKWSPFLSEKTFRPILNLQPFIYLGNHGGLDEIRRLGFKTFHPYIDESYALEADPKKRFAMIVAEINRLAAMPIETLHDLYYSMSDILIYNQQHFLGLRDFNPLEDFFSTF